MRFEGNKERWREVTEPIGTLLTVSRRKNLFSAGVSGATDGLLIVLFADKIAAGDQSAIATTALLLGARRLLGLFTLKGSE
jgi:hypothetical protein